MRALLLSLSLLLSLAQPAGSDQIDPARAFAESYNIWIRLHQDYNPLILNTSELKAWQDTKSKWKELQHFADSLY